VLAAEQDQAEQELPKSICQPRHVRLSKVPQADTSYTQTLATAGFLGGGLARRSNFPFLIMSRADSTAIVSTRKQRSTSNNERSVKSTHGLWIIEFGF
jgi:hypothetical protein